MATKINTRSPFYLKVSHPQLTEAQLQLYIYEGVKDTTPDSNDLKYTITKPTIGDNEYVVFEIAELVRDYINLKYDGNLNSYTVWVNPIFEARRANGTIIGTGVVVNPDNTDQFVATDGYGYFDEGINPDIDKGLMMSEGTIYKADSLYDNSVESAYRARISSDGGVFEYNSLLEIFNDRSIGIPVSADTTNTVTFKYQGSAVKVVTITDNDNTNQKIQYASFNEGNVDEVEINYTKDSVTSTTNLAVKTFDCTRYEPMRLTFVNKFGAFQDLYFTKKSSENLSIKTNEYKAAIIDYDNLSYDTAQHQQQTYDLIANESIVLNSDFISEDNNEYIKQLMMSEQVWLTKLNNIDNVIPVKLNTKSLQIKTSVNDRLIQYTIELQIAADKINTIR